MELFAKDLRPCPPLDKGAREFKALRSQLLGLMPNGNGEGGPYKKVSAAAMQGGKSACGAAFAEAGGGGEEEEKEDHAAHCGRSGSRRIGGRDDSYWNNYWSNVDLTLIKRVPRYHGVKDKTLKPQLDALGFSNYRSKDSVVFRHQTYLKLGDTERDKLKMGIPTRSRSEVIDEVSQAKPPPTSPVFVLGI